MLSTQRFMLYVVNNQMFNEFAISDILTVIIKGFKYDILTIIYINTPFIFLYLYPIKRYNSPAYQFLLKFIFVSVNLAITVFNLIDINIYSHRQHRLLIFDIHNNLMQWWENFQQNSWQIFVREHLSLTIFLLGFAIIIFLLSNLIKRQDYETKNKYTLLKISSLSTVLLIVGIFAYQMRYSTSELHKKLYIKADRKLVSILVNNPYLLMQDYFANEKKLTLNDSWYLNDYSSVNQCYNTVNSLRFNHIKLIVSSVEKLPINKQTNAKFHMISNRYRNVFQMLDELLFSFPAIFQNGFYRSSYALKNTVSLVDILKSQGYFARLTTLGYNKDSTDLIRNFYRLNNYAKQDSSKSFELILINEKSAKSYSKILAKKTAIGDKTLIISILYDKKQQLISNCTLSQSMFFYAKSPLAFYTNPDVIITQLLDLKPSILQLTGYTKPFVSYGKSLFQRGNRCQYHIVSDSSYCAIFNNILLHYSKNQTISLKKIHNFKVSKYNFADSLAVERTLIETKLQSMLYDFRKRMILDTKKQVSR